MRPGVGQVSVVEMAADDEVAVVVAEVERPISTVPRTLPYCGLFPVSERRAEAVARIAAQADAQALHRAVVDAECAGQCDAGFRESGRMRAAGNPAAAAEAVGVEAREQHRLVLPGARTPRTAMPVSCHVEGSRVFSPSGR